MQSGGPVFGAAIEQARAKSSHLMNARKQTPKLKQQRFGDFLGFRIFESSQRLAWGFLNKKKRAGERLRDDLECPDPKGRQLRIFKLLHRPTLDAELKRRLFQPKFENVAFLSLHARQQVAGPEIRKKLNRTNLL